MIIKSDNLNSYIKVLLLQYIMYTLDYLSINAANLPSDFCNVFQNVCFCIFYLKVLSKKFVLTSFGS